MGRQIRPSRSGLDSISLCFPQWAQPTQSTPQDCIVKQTEEPESGTAACRVMRMSKKDSAQQAAQTGMFPHVSCVLCKPNLCKWVVWRKHSYIDQLLFIQSFTFLMPLCTRWCTCVAAVMLVSYLRRMFKRDWRSFVNTFKKSRWKYFKLITNMFFDKGHLTL